MLRSRIALMYARVILECRQLSASQPIKAMSQQFLVNLSVFISVTWKWSVSPKRYWKITTLGGGLGVLDVSRFPLIRHEHRMWAVMAAVPYRSTHGDLACDTAHSTKCIMGSSRVTIIRQCVYKNNLDRISTQVPAFHLSLSSERLRLDT